MGFFSILLVYCGGNPAPNCGTIRISRTNNVNMRTVLIAALACASLSSAENKKILAWGLQPDEVRELQEAAPGVTIVPVGTKELPVQVADADAILGIIDPALIRAGRKLRWVQVFSAGVETVISPELQNSPITLTNAKIIQGTNVSDHAFALLLALTRELYRAIPSRAREEWDGSKYSSLELAGKTAVVIGVGGLGTQIAQRAHAFGMKVIGVDPRDVPLNMFLSKVVPPDRLDAVLPLADVVFLSAPHTPESEGIMGRRQFELMKKGSYFIGISRGKLYDINALVKALDEKRLAGAGVDVTDPEPLPKGHPLWKFENVVITPHVAGQSDTLQARRMELIKENVRRFAAGEHLLNVVDKKKGY